MRESEFSELREYVDAQGSCIDMGYRPTASLIRKGWLEEVVSGCWAITKAGRASFEAVTGGKADLQPDPEEVA